jgi:hypothetical protein
VKTRDGQLGSRAGLISAETDSVLCNVCRATIGCNAELAIRPIRDQETIDDSKEQAPALSGGRFAHRMSAG